MGLLNESKKYKNQEKQEKQERANIIIHIIDVRKNLDGILEYSSKNQQKRVWQLIYN